MGTLRKILTTGVGAALMTESQIRRQAGDYIARQAQRGKEEVAKVLSGEIKRLLHQTDLYEIIHKALDGLTIEVDARIRLASSDHSGKWTRIKAVRPRRRSRPKGRGR